MKRLNISGLWKCILLASVFVLSGCWKEDNGDCPETGRLTLVTEWDDRAPHVAIPSAYDVAIGDFFSEFSQPRNVIAHEFQPGDYRGYVYNRPEKITVNGTTATVAASGTGIDNMPGFLFTWSDDITDLRKGETRTVVAPMKQQVGEINYRITMEDGSDITDYVKSINSVTVNGIASSIDLETGIVSGASDISPAFVLNGTDYEAQSRILGTVGTKQEIIIKYELMHGVAGEQTLTKEITSFLEGFNDHKTGAYEVIVVMLLTNIPGNVTLTTTWDGRSPDAGIPSPYTAKVGSYSEVVPGTTDLLDSDFYPGVHHVNVYNTPAQFTFENMYATVRAAGEGIDPMPDYLFTYTGDATIVSATGNTITAPMVQQVGTVNYVIEMKDGSDVNAHITGVSAALSGVASRINLENASLSFPSAIEPAFSAAGVKLTSKSRILGTIGTPMLTLDLTLSGSASQQTLTVDASTVLANFNAAKLGTYIIVVQIDAVDGLTGRITDWTVIDDFTGEID